MKNKLTEEQANRIEILTNRIKSGDAELSDYKEYESILKQHPEGYEMIQEELKRNSVDTIEDLYFKRKKAKKISDGFKVAGIIGAVVGIAAAIVYLSRE